MGGDSGAVGLSIAPAADIWNLKTLAFGAVRRLMAPAAGPRWQKRQRRDMPGVVGVTRIQRPSEAGLELHANRARLVDEAGQVVEVDAADNLHFVGDVATEQGDVVLAVLPGVAQAQTA